MKRFLSIVLAVLMLVPLFAFNIVGAENECTITEENCAGLANFSFEGAVWLTRKNELIDGDKSNGMAGSYNHKITTITMSYDEVNFFTDIVITVNGEGTLYGLEAESQPQGPTNSDYTLDVKLLDKNNNEVFAETGLTTKDKTEITVEANVEAKTIIISYTANWNTHNGIWEIEAFRQVGEHAWEYDSTTDSTCAAKGFEKYTCSCGATRQDELPLRPYHRWDNGTVQTPATETTSGIMIYKCLDCETAEKPVDIPATVHNAWDTGVVTAPTCTEDGYTTYTCTHCSEGITKKADFTSSLGHDIDDGTPIVRQTFTTTGTTKYACKRTECDYNYDAEVPVAQYTDSEFIIGIDNVTLSETDLEGKPHETPVEASPPSEAFDGLIMEKDLWKGANSDNFWKAPLETGGKLIIELDYEYLVTGAKIYAYGNYLNFEIEFFDANGESVLKSTQNAYQTPSDGVSKSPVSLSKDIFGLKVKKIVVTAKNDYSKTVSLSEIEITVHKCLYDDVNKANKVETPEECKTVFDGTCWMCGVSRTGVTEYNHSWTKEDGTDIDKIFVDTEASCYAPGAGHLVCTVCEEVENLVIEATGDHNFENGAEVIVEENNCGVDGKAYKKCATTGCTAQSEEYVLEATGKHSSFNLKDLPGQEADYTHKGVQGYLCSVCGYQDESRGTSISECKTLSCIDNKFDWEIRYTNFVSPRATFRVKTDKIEAIAENYSVKVFGVVKKGEEVREVQVYGDGATGKISSNGEFSLVVKDASYSDEFEFYVKIEITSKEDSSVGTTVVKSKALSTATDGIVSSYDVASYYLEGSRANNLDAEIKKLYEEIKASKQ